MPARLVETSAVIDRLLDLPGEITHAEEALQAVEEVRLQAVEDLQDATDTLLLEGCLDGKNAEVRAAQLRQALIATAGDPLGKLTQGERTCAAAKRLLHAKQNEFAALRACARLMAAFSNE